MCINNAREPPFAISTTSSTTMTSPLSTPSLLLVSHLIALVVQASVNTDIAAGESIPQNQTSTLPEGYVAHPDIGAAYKVHDHANVTWIEAKENCILEGAQLAVIDSGRKMEYAKHPPLVQGSVRHVGMHWVNDDWFSVTNATTSQTGHWPEDQLPVDGFYCLMLQLAPDDVMYPVHLTNGRCEGDDHRGDYICEIPLPADV